MNPQINERPPGDAGFLIKVAIGDNKIKTTFADARTAAFLSAASRPYNDTGPPGVIASTLENWVSPTVDGDKQAAAQIGKYFVRGYSATCYLEAWWDEVTFEGFLGDATEVSRVGRNTIVTFPTFGGVCLPEGFDNTDVTTWPMGEEFDIGGQVPSFDPDEGFQVIRYVTLDKLRWSFLSGYTPPDDGSANGFPS